MASPACPPPTTTVSNRSVRACLLLSMSLRATVGRQRGSAASRGTTNSGRGPRGQFGPATRLRRGRARMRTRSRPCARRRLSLAKMFCTCRATVCSLMTSSAAISRLLLPAATRRRTSSSRGVRPCVCAGRARGARPDVREIRRRAERRERRRARRSSSSVAVSSSPSARQASPIATARTPPRTARRAPARPCRARRADARAARASPVGEVDGPRACAASAASIVAVVCKSASVLELARRPRAPPRRHPSASTISTYAGRSAARV